METKTIAPAPAAPPGFAEALRAVKDKRFQEAMNLLQKVLQQAPGFAPAHFQVAQLLSTARGKAAEAEASYRKALELAPGEPHVWRGLGHFYRRQRQLPRARQAFEKAAQLAPNDLETQADLLRIQRAMKDDAAAMATVDRMLAQKPDDAFAATNRAELLESAGKVQEALAQYAKVVSGREVPNKALERWAQLMMRHERSEELLDWLESRMKANPDSFFLRLIAGGTYVNEGLYERAIAVLEEAEKLEPGNLRLIHDMAVTLRFQGRIEESRQWISRMLEKDPYNASALRVYGADEKYAYGEPSFNRLMRASARIAEYTPPGRVQLHFALGKAFDDVGDLATAFEHFETAGKLHLKQHPQDTASAEVFLGHVRKAADRELLRNPDHPGHPSNKPIFVLGMPRSGTTLVEQVLASHPDVEGAGELKHMSRAVEGIVIGGKLRLDLKHKAPFFPIDTPASYAERGRRYVETIEKYCGKEAKHIVDKMPGNYMWTGLIHLMLPNAPIVHTRRHPVETCLSAYRIYFPDGQYWSFDLKEMGRTYRRYVELMAHWRESMPEGRMLEVRYEDMVNDFEAQARRLVAYCGLPWNDACLNFHETDRAVRTASASQVRKPVYKSSIGRWRKYEPYLKPLLDELGPLVQQYEDELVQAAPAGVATA